MELCPAGEDGPRTQGADPRLRHPETADVVIVADELVPDRAPPTAGDRAPGGGTHCYPTLTIGNEHGDLIGQRRWGVRCEVQACVAVIDHVE